MPEIADLLPHARNYRASAVRSLLESYYPTVYRIASALCGNQHTAGEVIYRVMSRAIPAIPKWRDDSAADRWFYHYTVLETRRYEAIASDLDPLIAADPPNPEYSAFILALRAMPAQHREAIILSHGEHLNPRYLGVAMDCSAEAAANHLRAATIYLQSITGGQITPMLEIFSKCYHRLDLSPQTARPMIQQRINRFLFPRRLKRCLLLLIITAAIAAGLWRFFPLIPPGSTPRP